MFYAFKKQEPDEYSFKIPQRFKKKEKQKKKAYIDPLYKSNGQRKARASEPIRDKNDVRAVMEYFLNSNQTHKYRNYMIFVLGINTRRRCGDLIRLRVCDVYDTEHDKMYDKAYMGEEKTDKSGNVYLNKYAQDAIMLYLNNKYRNKKINSSDWLLWSQKPDLEGEHRLSVIQIWKILNKAAKDLKLDVHMGTHTMRRTGARELYLSNPNDKEALPMLQEDLHHSSQDITLRYMGISDDKRKELVMNLSWDN
jgi:integrase